MMAPRRHRYVKISQRANFHAMSKVCDRKALSLSPHCRTPELSECVRRSYSHLVRRVCGPSERAQNLASSKKARSELATCEEDDSLPYSTDRPISAERRTYRSDLVSFSSRPQEVFSILRGPILHVYQPLLSPKSHAGSADSPAAPPAHPRVLHPGAYMPRVACVCLAGLHPAIPSIALPMRGVAEARVSVGPRELATPLTARMRAKSHVLSVHFTAAREGRWRLLVLSFERPLTPGARGKSVSCRLVHPSFAHPVLRHSCCRIPAAAHVGAASPFPCIAPHCLRLAGSHTPTSPHHTPSRRRP